MNPFHLVDSEAQCMYCGAPVPDQCRPLEDGEDTEDVIAEDPSWHAAGCSYAEAL